MPRLTRVLNAALLACTLVLPASAQTSERLVLSDVIAEVRDHNPEIRAARDRVSAAKARPAQVSAYDDPMVSYEAWNAPEPFRIDHADNNIFRLSQKIPFPGKRSLAGTMAARDADVAEQNLRSVELDAVAAATKAYYDLWMVHQNILIYSRDKDLVERFAKIAEQKYAVGRASEPDVLRAQVELTRLINRVTTETLAADDARAALNALLSHADDEPLGLPEDPPPPLFRLPPCNSAGPTRCPRSPTCAPPPSPTGRTCEHWPITSMPSKPRWPWPTRTSGPTSRCRPDVS